MGENLVRIRDQSSKLPDIRLGGHFMRQVYRPLIAAALLATLLIAAPTPAGAAFSSTDSVWALTASDKLVRFAAGTPGTAAQTLTITGLQAGDVLIGADYRPADGKLYAVSNGSRVYQINETTGAATLVTTITPALSGTDFGVDFNPVADRLRIVSDTDQNVRVNVSTGTATVDTALAYAGGDVNVAANPQEIAVAYTNPVSGATTTTLYGIDAGTDSLVLQNPPNNGTLNTVGALGVDVGVSTGFDITPNGTLAAAITLAGGTSTGYYTINSATGAATIVGTIAGGEIVKDLVIPLPTQAPVWALTPNNEIATLSGSGIGRVAATVAITGLQAGEDVLAIDVRPANGKLYGLGSTSRIYVIDPVSGAAHPVNATPFTPALNGTEFGFDFNPVVDRIRITSDGDQNFRIHPDTGAIAGSDTALAYAGGDVSDGVNPNIVASAYTNNVDGATTTSLYDLDSGTNDLSVQNPPNLGTLTTVGDTSIDVPSVTGLDIGSDGNAWAVTRVGSDTKLYQINLSTGVATLEGQVPVEIDDIAIKLTFPTGNGYVLGALDGGVFNYGSAEFKGSAGSLDLNAPMIGIESKLSGQGYWLVATDGGIFAYGDSKFYGSAGSIDLNDPVVGMAAHPSNKGYWLVAEDGGVFAYGDAKFYGSTGGMELNAPIVGMASTVTGQGYWLFAEDGGVFAYGDAKFYGSAGSIDLNEPIVGGAAAADGSGYYLVAFDGGVFAYGPGAVFAGSTGSIDLNQPVIDIAVDRDGAGYHLVAFDGGVFSYNATFSGSAGSIDLNAPVVSIATQ